MNPAVFIKELPPAIYTNEFRTTLGSPGMPATAYGGYLKTFGYNLPGEFIVSTVIALVRMAGVFFLRITSGSILNANFTLAFIIANSDTYNPNYPWYTRWLGDIGGFIPVLFLCYLSACVQIGELTEIIMGRHFALELPKDELYTNIGVTKVRGNISSERVKSRTVNNSRSRASRQVVVKEAPPQESMPLLPSNMLNRVF